jgi:1-hydroxycarotenoid 3,4-desaturase
MIPRSVVVIGAGVGGLVASLLLSAAGLRVTVCETAATPGGKLAQAELGGARIDAGPTVFTLRPFFEQIFAAAGAKLHEHLVLERLELLARHFWDDGARLDLFDDPRRNEAAIAAFAGAEAARGYARFSQRAQQVFETLDASFMQVQQPGLLGLMRNAGPGLLGISPFSSLWKELGHYFTNPKLRQLFARYATYCGSSPFDAPATLMLVAHAEQLGVWRIKGGMFSLANALEGLAVKHGAVFRFNAKVSDILVSNGRVGGVRLEDGEIIACDAVIANADPAALAAGLFGKPAQAAVAATTRGATPSLSALTWAISGRADGVPLAHHNVFFAEDYAAEFAAINRQALPRDPTIYLCAPEPGQFFCLVNAPAEPHNATAVALDVEGCFGRVTEKLARSGCRLQPDAMRMTGPQQWAQRFPGTGGALYGRALTGWRDSFARPGARTKLPGLYLAGGGVHPGPGLPMAATSGRLAAECVLTGT